MRLRFGHEKKFYNHSQPFHWFKKGSCQLRGLPRNNVARLADLTRNDLKMCRRAIKHQHNQPASVRWNIQGKRNCYNIIGSITSSLSSATPGKKCRWVLKCLLCVEKPYILNIWVCWQPKCSLMSIKHPKHPKTCYICYQNSSKETKKAFWWQWNE